MFGGLRETVKPLKRSENERKQLYQWIREKHVKTQKAYITGRAERVSNERNPFMQPSSVCVHFISFIQMFLHKVMYASNSFRGGGSRDMMYYYF